MSAAAATITERNRANAQHSTGPVTDAGKASSSQNARKHGLTGQLRLQSQEEAERFDSRVAEYADWYKLNHPEAARLIRELVTAEFRMDQIASAQSATVIELQEKYIDELDESVTVPDMINARLAAKAYIHDHENGNVLNRLHRYFMAAERLHRQTRTRIEQLVQEQAERRRLQAQLKSNPIKR